jgi:hypothetical protein
VHLPACCTAIRQKVEEVERQHTEAQNEVQRLQAEQEELQRQVPHQGDKWLGLAGTCVDARQPQYTYRGCLFGKASQIDNNAGHETSLGNWKGFSEDMTKVGGPAAAAPCGCHLEGCSRVAGRAATMQCNDVQLFPVYLFPN